jgi:CheY-like chemotaxis protein
LKYNICVKKAINAFVKLYFERRIKMGFKDKLEGLKDVVDDALEKTELDDKIKAKAQEALDKTDFDEKIKEGAKGLKAKAEDALEKTDIDDRVAGLDAGADDYLPKPFAMKEFLARVRALVRRGGSDDSRDKIMYAGLVLNGEDLSLSSENTVRLSLKEYELMREFMKNPGRELATDYLLWKIWNKEKEADEDTVWLYVSYLKNKLRSIVTAVTITGDKGGAFILTE